MAINTALPSQRMRLLFDQMEAEGLSQAEMARRSGYGETALSKFREKGSTRQFDLETITRVIQTLGLDANFFFSADLGAAPRYVHHLRRRREHVPFWDDFVANYARIVELDDADLERIQNVATEAHKITSWQSWATLASWYLDHRRRTE